MIKKIHINANMNARSSIVSGGAEFEVANFTCYASETDVNFGQQIIDFEKYVENKTAVATDYASFQNECIEKIEKLREVNE